MRAAAHLSEEVEDLLRGDGRIEVAYVHGTADLLDPLRVHVAWQRRVLREPELGETRVDRRDHLVRARPRHLQLSPSW